MEAIALELGISRSSVSRIIAFARDSGLEEIRLRPPVNQLHQLQHQLHDRFGLTAHIVPAGDAATGVGRLERDALSAARILSDFVDSTMFLGVAWRSTIAPVNQHLVRKPLRNTQVVQLNGAVNTHTAGLVCASEIIGRFGATFGAAVLQFPVHAFFDDPATKEALWRERSTARVLAVQRRIDVAVFGIGSPSADVPSHVCAGGYLDRADYDDLARSRVVGDIATIFFRADGSHDAIPLNDRSSGPGFDVLMRVPRRIAVVSGRAKLPALRGTVATGVITDLVVDEITARQLAAMD